MQRDREVTISVNADLVGVDDEQNCGGWREAIIPLFQKSARPGQQIGTNWETLGGNLPASGVRSATPLWQRAKSTTTKTLSENDENASYLSTLNRNEETRRFRRGCCMTERLSSKTALCRQRAQPEAKFRTAPQRTSPWTWQTTQYVTHTLETTPTQAWQVTCSGGRCECPCGSSKIFCWKKNKWSLNFQFTKNNETLP